MTRKDFEALADIVGGLRLRHIDTDSTTEDMYTELRHAIVAFCMDRNERFDPSLFQKRIDAASGDDDPQSRMLHMYGGMK